MGLLTIAGASQLNESSMARNNSDKCANDIFLLLATGLQMKSKKMAGKFVVFFWFPSTAVTIMS
ncbi:MAG: hypothetical protein Q8P67_24435, partial [archaeon]|nr:hypothetical protein [archaeon]